ncbi:MAG TPA: hypothetical protein DCS38_00805, partial [Ruminococcus sp.]|nr:hypothetical protein [Ruminococcus sp.]
MKKYIDDYVAYIEKYLENPDPETIENIRKEHLVQIQFIQHERLIHWLVTMFVGILLFICIAVLVISPESSVMLPLVLLFLILVIPYLLYYYYIENITQKLYTLYNKLCDAEKNIKG